MRGAPAAALAPTSPWVRRLTGLARLDADDRALLEAWSARPRRLAPGAVLAQEGDLDPFVHVVLSGWLLRQRLLPDGRRQILSLLLPGDEHGFRSDAAGPARHALVALNTVEVATLPLEEVLAATEARPRLKEALTRSALGSQAIVEERLMSLGLRSALERTAHLICEVLVRVGRLRDEDDSPVTPFPLTQGDVSDVLGLSIVHVNRTLQALRKMELLRLGSGRLEVVDREGLARLAGFDPAYLDA